VEEIDGKGISAKEWMLQSNVSEYHLGGDLLYPTFTR
jgi:hypothetical protein